MPSSYSSFVSLVCLSFVVCALRESFAEKTKACMQNGAIRMTGRRENATCGFVTGLVEVCEGMQWRRICDNQWTVEDARVVCRELDLFSPGAVNVTATQMASTIEDLSAYLPQCSGSEEVLANCSTSEAPSDLLENCMTVARVQCYFNESSARMCGAVPTVEPSPTAAETEPPGAVTEPSDDTSPNSQTSDSTQESTSDTILNTTEITPTPDPSTDPSTSQSLLQPFHYGIIGAIVAFLIILVLLIAICLLVVCVKTRRKAGKHAGSPRPGSAEDQKSELGEIRYHPEPTSNASSDIVEPGGSGNEPRLPIYEAIAPATAEQSVESPLSLNKSSPTETDPLCSQPGPYASLDTHQPQYQTLEAFTGNPESKRTSLPTHHPTESSYSHYLELDRSLPKQKKRTLSATVSATNAVCLQRQNSTGGEVLPENEYSTVQESRKQRNKATASLDRRNPGQYPLEPKYRGMVHEKGEAFHPADELQSQQQHTYAILEPPPPPVMSQQQPQRYPPISVAPLVNSHPHQTQVAVNGRSSGEIELATEQRSADCMDTLV